MSMDVSGVGKSGSVHEAPKAEQSPRAEQPPKPPPEPIPASKTTVEEARKSAEYEKYVEQIIHTVAPYNRELRYVINHDTGQVVVKVIDAKTDKVIKEIPPEEIQRLEARIREAIGLLVDKKI